VESVAGDKWVNDLAKDNEGLGVALGRRVVLRLGVSVGCEERVADIFGN
jgi:hypothetical protein